MPFDVVYRRGGGIAYADEIVTDRGILWTRMHSEQRDGRPEFGKVHSLRQRRAMRRLLCQPGPTAPVVVEPVVVSFEDHAIPWIRAVGLVRELLDCALLSLEELAESQS